MKVEELLSLAVGFGASAISYIPVVVGTAGGIAGIISFGLVYSDRRRSSTPSVAVQAIDLEPTLPNLGKRAVAVVTNPRATSITVQTNPDQSDFFLFGHDDDDRDTYRLVGEVEGDGWRETIPPGGAGIFTLMIKLDRKSCPPDTTLRLSLTWVPTQFRRRRPAPTPLQCHITRQHFDELTEGSGVAAD